MRIKFKSRFTNRVHQEKATDIIYSKILEYSPSAVIHSFLNCLEENSSSFSKEELELLNELIESKDKDNLIIAFTIIDGK